MITINKNSWHYKIYSLFSSNPPSTICTYLWSQLAIALAATTLLSISVVLLEFTVSLFKGTDKSEMFIKTLKMGAPNWSAFGINLSIGIAAILVLGVAASLVHRVIKRYSPDPKEIYAFCMVALGVLVFGTLGSFMIGGFAMAFIIPLEMLEPILGNIDIHAKIGEPGTEYIFEKSVLVGFSIIVTISSIVFSIYKIYQWSMNNCAKVQVQ